MFILKNVQTFFSINQETRRLIRNIENIEKKLINCQLAVVLNETCLYEDTLPIYTNLYIYVHYTSNEGSITIAIMNIMIY